MQLRDIGGWNYAFGNDFADAFGHLALISVVVVLCLGMLRLRMNFGSA